MASLYDAILVKGNLRPRLNKSFIGADKVPKVVMEVLTTDNIVDENGMIVVDTKKAEANQPTDENKEDLTGKEDGSKLQRVDQSKTDEPEQTEEDAVPSDANQTSVEIDDSANENQTQEGGEDETSTSDENSKQQTAPVAAPAPEADRPATEPAQDEPAQEEVSKKPRRTTTAAKPVEKFRSLVPQSSPGMSFPRKNGKTVDIFDLKTPHTHIKLVAGVTVPLSAESFKTKGDIAIQNRLEELGIETIDFNRLEREAMSSGVQAGDPSLIMDDDESDDEEIKLG